MARYLIRQGLSMTVTLLVAMVLLFIVMQLNSDVFVAGKLGIFSTQEGTFVKKTEFQLNLPIDILFFKWISKVISGRIFTTNATNISILPHLLSSLKGSASVIVLAVLISLIITILLSLISINTKSRKVDGLCRILAVLGLSIPEMTYYLSLYALLGSSYLGLSFLGQGYLLFKSKILNFVVLNSLVTLFLVFRLYGVSFRYLRSQMLTVMNQEFITAEKSRGLSAYRINFGSIVRNSYVAIIPCAGTMVVEAMSSLVILEGYLSRSGFFGGFLNAAKSRDSFLVMAYFIVTIAALYALNLFLDFLLSLTDPRVIYD